MSQHICCQLHAISTYMSAACLEEDQARGILKAVHALEAQVVSALREIEDYH